MAEKRGKRRFRSSGRSRLGVWTVVVLVVIVAGWLAALEYSRPHVTGDPLRLDTFVQMADAGQIVDATILDADGYVVGSYVPGEPQRSTGGSSAADDHIGGTVVGTAPKVEGETRAYNVPYLKMSLERIVDVLLRAGVPTAVEQQNEKRVVETAALAFPALIIVVVFIYFILSYRRGTGLFSITSGARRVRAEQTGVTFKDVAGQEEAIAEIREVALFLSNPDRFLALGAQVPKGILLYGPPGCGKTLMARALAGEAGANFFSISGSDFVELYVGVGASRVRELFREAREHAPAIVFIDELDSIGRRRGSGGSASTGSREEGEQALNQLLAEMDGFSPMQGIIVLGATNRPDTLDPALLRPGRFDRSIGLDRPDETGRMGILEVHARGKPMGADVRLADIAHKAVGMSGADIASIVNEAALLAARGGSTTISQAHLEKALTRILDNPERQRRLSMRERTLGQGSLAEEKVTFEDVGGVDEAIDELREVRDYLDDPERYASMGARPPRGFLLVGPPGCGKTLLARAVAHESNAVFLAVASTEFTEVFVGEGAARVRDLFAQARAMQPSVVFIDELDAIGARRGPSLEGHREREQTLNQILIELDGFGARTGVIVMAASNRPEILDPALVRPGRFDRTITLGLPDRAGRRQILAIHSAGKPLAPDVDLDAIAGLTRGLSGADLANVLNEATLLAARRGRNQVDMALIEEGIERVSLGIARSHILGDEERRLVACHEAGHAIVARSLPGGGNLPHKITIMPRGKALGAAWYQDTRERVLHSRSALIDEMATLLGGRVAEEVVFGDVSSGAADDLERVGAIARMMIVELGMSTRLGPLTYKEGPDMRGASISDATAEKIDDETRAIVEEAYGRARAVLTAERKKLDAIATVLMERETLNAQEFEALLDDAQVVRAKVAGGRRTHP